MKQKPNTIKKPGLQKSHRALWSAVILMLFCELLFYTWIRVEATHNAFNITKLQENLAKATSYQAALVLEKERLNSLDRISKIAVSKLALSLDTTGKIIYLTEEEW
ncbi:MAG: hypothetical protein GY729_12855 [Desulfobacteraceae bacterium]|nr:hypothetical protein [Desulfobacteraceae bacterium]